MKRFQLRKKTLSLLLASVLCFCAWLFGWGRGTIDVIDFSADQVDYVRLSCAQLYSEAAAEIRDPEEIQALIDSANALQHTGSSFKRVFQYGLGVGGSKLHEHAFFLKSGDTFILTFSSNNGERPISDMDLSYWATLPNGERISGSTCRGSLEVFYELHQKYLPY